MKKIAISQIFIALFIISFYVNAQESTDNNTTFIKHQNTKSIDEVYGIFALGHAVKHKKILGQFVYIESNKDLGKYLAKFITKEIVQTISYVSYADNEKDVITLNKQAFSLENKIDPTSLTIYWVYSHAKKFLCLIGKGQSASGSGLQVSYFVLFELDKLGKVISHQEFVSRFGNINSLVDYDKNANLEYIKVINGKKTDEYLLTINDIETDKQYLKKSILLKYKLNDKFIIIQEAAESP